jgi:late competence protein required for DNA uptake (superfamily II DNA/RNA helicase)
MTEKTVTCDICGQEISQADSYRKGGKTICEDCMLGSSQKVQACDPLAARSAEIFRDKAGIESTGGLTDLQREICEFVRTRGRTTADELLRQFPISGPELENQVAILRHCNLVKGQKKGAVVYLVPF